MKPLFLIIFFFLSTSVLFSQNDIAKSQAIFSPDRPTIGDSIHVLFIPSTESELLKVDTVFLQVQFYPVNKKHFMDEYLMRKTSAGWETVYKLERNDIGCMVFQFATNEPFVVDCNNYAAWDLMVYNEHGIPIKGAHSSRARSYYSAIPMQRMQNMGLFNTELLEELKAFPEDPHNVAKTWWARIMNTQKVDSTISVIDKEIDSLTNRYPTNKEIFSTAYSYYKEIRKEEKAAEMLTKLNVIDSNNSAPLWIKRGKYFFSPDRDKKLLAYLDILKECKDSVLYDCIQRDIFQIFKSADYYEQAIKYLKEWRNPDLEEIASLSYYMLQTLEDKIAKNSAPGDLDNKIKLSDEQEQIRKQLQQSRYIAEEAIRMYQEQADRGKDSTLSPSMWENQKRRMMGLSFRNIATSNYLLRDLDEVEKYFMKSKALLKKSFYVPTFCVHYVKFLIETKKYKEACDIASKSIEYFPDYDETPLMKKLYLQATKNTNY